MSPEEAVERTEQQGKDPSGKKDKKSKYYNDKNFITRATLSEIQRQKAIKMVEDLLMKQKNKDNSEVGEKKKEDVEKQFSNIIKKNVSSLIKQAEKEGLSRQDIIKMLGSE
jgi:DNA-binding transcriptional regulator YhcF (GntR family)